MDVIVVQVKAIHNFKGQNNDELNADFTVHQPLSAAVVRKKRFQLCFKKGQVITVTQNDDQNWWEGTLDGNTGWFPSNYVESYKHKAGKDGSSGGTTAVAVSPSTDELSNRALVLRNILDSERLHIAELKKLINSCLKPLGSHKLLCVSEFTTLVCNLEEIVSVHEQLLLHLEGEDRKDSNDQRVGAVFLAMAAKTLKGSHRQYCAQHPRAVCYLQEHKCEINKYVEKTSLCDDESSNNSSSSSSQKLPGLLVLTTYLSKPFRRLQQYPGLLQELYRHQHEAHRDRGDAHRAAKVMTDLAANCNTLRRQKELELEVVTARIEGWEQRGTLAVLGEVQAMGSVAVLPDHTDKYLVVFPLHLVLLAVSPKMSNFIFQAQYNLSEINCCKLGDCDQYKNAFELTGLKMERLVAVCQTKADQQRWFDTFTQLISSASAQPPALPSKGGGGSLPVTAAKGQPALVAGGSTKNSALGVVVSAAQSSATERPASHTAGVGASNLPNVPLTVTQLQQPPLPPHKVPPKPVATKGGIAPVSAPPRSQAAASVGASPMPPSCLSHGPNGSTVRQATVNHKTWSLCDLRPSPPLRPKQLKRARHIKKDERWHDEDSVILRVVEAYCASTAMRQSKNHDSASPGMGKRQDRSASQVSSFVDERSLTSAVTMLRAELSRLTQDHQQLRQQFEIEKSANMYLRTTIQRLMPYGK